MIAKIVYRISRKRLNRGSRSQVSVKQAVLKKFGKLTGKRLTRFSFEESRWTTVYNFTEKDTAADVLSCEFRKSFQKKFFKEHLLLFTFLRLFH